MLTQLQLEVLQYLADGKRQVDIAWLWKKSIRVVKLHAKGAVEKLEAETTMHAVAIALRRGLIE